MVFLSPHGPDHNLRRYGNGGFDASWPGPWVRGPGTPKPGSDTQVGFFTLFVKEIVVLMPLGPDPRSSPPEVVVVCAFYLKFQAKLGGSSKHENEGAFDIKLKFNIVHQPNISAFSEAATVQNM